MAEETEAHGKYAVVVDSMVWVPCQKSGFRRARVVSIDGTQVLVDCEADKADPSSGGQRHIPIGEARPLFDKHKPHGAADSTELVFLDDANILHNLQIRFLTDNIYTYTANVLLAVNPYKPMPHLYTNEQMTEYRNIRNMGSKPPHPYAIADIAYRHLIREWRDQALVISGESGAGKTETAKITMRYLAEVSRTDAAHGVRIQDKIINANPILESFGNAQTVRNRNSSRFGKYNEMQFNRVGSLVGAGIKTYLLESSRVVSQQTGEQNYHVFYQMLYGLEASELERMELDSRAKYQLLYTEKSQVPDASSQERHQGRDEFLQLRKALDVVGMDASMQSEIFEVVAALIHLGEIQFETVAGADNQNPVVPEDFASDSSQSAFVDLKNQDSLCDAAELMGLSETRLLQVLKWKEMRVPSRKSHIRCPRTKSQSYQTLHSIIRILYKRLFELIVDRINATSSSGASRQDGDDRSYQADHVSIGTLDIYGFERLTVNSFEQLCINLANERLQQFFVEEVLQAEQDMYGKERIRVEMFDLPDSKPVVASIQSVLSILDDHSRRFFKNLVKAGDDTDQKFCENVYRDHITNGLERRQASNAILPLKLKASRGVQVGLNDGFFVRHYAGEVEYRTVGWIQKNNDALVPEIESLLTSSSKRMVANLAGAEAAEAVTGERFTSVSNKYFGNLSDLLTTLQRCRLHYIRCFNPNDKRAPGVFNSKYVLEQVIQCGTVELVNIMHNGYPNRCKLDEIRKRFSKLLPAYFQRYGDRDFAEAIMLAFEIDQIQWTVGTSRLFLKAGQLHTLEHLLDSGSMASQDVILKIRRQFLRKKFRSACNVILFAKWLPKYARGLRTVAVRRALQKTCFVYVRIYRWLNRARKVEPVQPDYPLERVVRPTPKYELIDFLYPAKIKVQMPCPRQPMLFNALNRHEIQECSMQLAPQSLPEVSLSLKGQIDWQKQVHDTVLAMWQKATTENLLFFDGRHLISTRFDPKMFLQRDGDAIGQLHEGCLTDDRYIDVAETGLAMQNREELSKNSEISLMCQHRRNSQMFASVHESCILIWSWFGTDRYDSEKMAVLCHCGLPRDETRIIYGMCFLSEVPDDLASSDGQVLVLLMGCPDRPWLTVSFVLVCHGSHRILYELNIGQDGSLLEAARSGPIFQISHSDRVLVVGGKKTALFFEVQRMEAPNCFTGELETQLSLALITDLVKMEDPDDAFNFVSCMCIPGRNGLDWIELSGGEGYLYGFLFTADASNKMVIQAQGRMSSKQNKHDADVAVSLLVPTFGSTPYWHYGKIKDQFVTYSNFLQGMECERDRFFTFGDNGKLLSWTLGKTGWTSQVEECLHDVLEDRCSQAERVPRHFIAAQCSRLVPHVLVVVDHCQKLICVDTTKTHEHMPTEATHVFGKIGGA